LNRIVLRRLLLAVLSAGWVLPMWLGVETVLQFLAIELWPHLLGKPRGNSFHFPEFASDCFALAFAWLGLAIGAWAWAGIGALRRTTS
jgi:hypothetical protein